MLPCKPSRWRIRVFARRNRYGRAGRRRLSRPASGRARSSFSDESSASWHEWQFGRLCIDTATTQRSAETGTHEFDIDDLKRVLASLQIALMQGPQEHTLFNRAQNWVRMNASNLPIGTQKQVRFGPAHANFGCFSRRNGYASPETAQISTVPVDFLWITLWTTPCCPRRNGNGLCAEAGTVSRRSGYANTQNQVRPFAESGTKSPPKPSADKALRGAYTVYL